MSENMIQIRKQRRAWQPPPPPPNNNSFVAREYRRENSSQQEIHSQAEVNRPVPVNHQLVHHDGIRRGLVPSPYNPAPIDARLLD